MLRNLQGICRKRDMDHAKYDALVRAQETYVQRITADTRFTTRLLCQMHRDWLGGLYSWAGHYRSVDVEKAGFRWPPASRVA